MSTKTTFKRIALVAVAALGLGVLSVAPSSAVAGLTATVANGTAGLPGAASDSTTAATLTVAGLMEANDSITVEIILKSYPATTTGAASAALTQVNMINLESTTPVITGYTVETLTAANFDASDAIAAGTGNAFVKNTSTKAMVSSTGTVIRISKASSAANVSHKFGFQLDSTTTADGGTDTRTAGTYTYTAIVKAYTAGSASPTVASQTIIQDFSITIAAAAADSETPSAAYTTAYLGSATAPSADTAGLNAVATASTTAAAYLGVRVRNASDAAAAIDTVTITVTGPGLLVNGSTYTKYAKIVEQEGDVTYSIIPDGNAGTTTISVAFEKAAVTVTKSMTFYSAAAKAITAANFHPVLAVGANTGAVAVVATDANGNAWTGTAYIYASSATDAAVAGSTTPVQCAAWNSTTGILCPVTALTVGTAKLKVIDASTVAAATATSNEVTVKVSNQAAASVKLAFDKASYGPNEKALITVTPLDSAGNTMQGKSWTALLASGGITSNVAFASGSDTLTATIVPTSSYSSSSSDLVAGSKTYVVYMPAASGDVTISATGGTDLPAAAQVKVTATATVVNASVDAATDAANEATDAANAATDAALAAADAADAATAAAQDASDAVAALSASVSKMISNLRAQITSLTNLVIKIQKKVKA